MVFFSAVEMALLIVRNTRLKTLAESDDRHASSVLHIQNNPGDFLSTVQTGITLVGTAASVSGGVGIVHLLTPLIARFSVLAPYAEGIALTGVIMLIAYFTLVIGKWAFLGSTTIAEVGKLLGVDLHPRGVYVTLAGFIFASLGKIPEIGEEVNKYGYVFSVREMNRLRITSIHVRRNLYH